MLNTTPAHADHEGANVDTLEVAVSPSCQNEMDGRPGGTTSSDSWVFDHDDDTGMFDDVTFGAFTRECFGTHNTGDGFSETVYVRVKGTTFGTTTLSVHCGDRGEFGLSGYSVSGDFDTGVIPLTTPFLSGRGGTYDGECNRLRFQLSTSGGTGTIGFHSIEAYEAYTEPPDTECDVELRDVVHDFRVTRGIGHLRFRFRWLAEWIEPESATTGWREQHANVWRIEREADQTVISVFGTSEGSGTGGVAGEYAGGLETFGLDTPGPWRLIVEHDEYGTLECYIPNDALPALMGSITVIPVLGPAGILRQTGCIEGTEGVADDCWDVAQLDTLAVADYLQVDIRVQANRGRQVVTVTAWPAEGTGADPFAGVEQDYLLMARGSAGDTSGLIKYVNAADVSAMLAGDVRYLVTVANGAGGDSTPAVGTAEFAALTPRTLDGTDPGARDTAQGTLQRTVCSEGDVSCELGLVLSAGGDAVGAAASGAVDTLTFTLTAKEPFASAIGGGAYVLALVTDLASEVSASDDCPGMVLTVEIPMMLATEAPIDVGIAVVDLDEAIDFPVMRCADFEQVGGSEAWQAVRTVMGAFVYAGFALTTLQHLRPRLGLGGA